LGASGATRRTGLSGAPRFCAPAPPAAWLNPSNPLRAFGTVLAGFPYSVLQNIDKERI
jgi:hypothetical protein